MTAEQSALVKAGAFCYPLGMNKKRTPNVQEVEIRAILKPGQFNSILARIKKEKGRFLGVETLRDVYFCPKTIKSFKAIEMDKVGSYSLRLRSRKKGNKKASDLNVKVITSKGDHNSWQEHETAIDNPDEMRSVLGVFGFKEYFCLEKIRQSYKIGRMTVQLEKIKDFGFIIEIEILTTKEKEQEAKSEIRLFLSKSGVLPEQIVAKSVTNILMRKLAKF